MGYGASYFYCNGVATPRGSQGRLAWQAALDANLAYQPTFAKGLTLKVDVFNILNRKTVTSRTEVRDSEGTIGSTYLQIVSQMAPRSARLTAEYNYKF